SSDQILHDRVNLFRLVRRLEKAVAEPERSQDASQDAWLKSQGMLQKLSHARKLLRNVETYEELQVSPKSRRHYDDLRQVIDRLEERLTAESDNLTPAPSRPSPLLPTVPLPPPSARRANPPPIHKAAHSSSALSVPEEVEPPEQEAELLLGPEDRTPPPALDPLPQGSSLALPSSSTSAPTPAFLQNSSAVQEELSAQLAQMAGQLRRNALHFSEALAKDQAALQDTDEKIGSNFDVMKKERLRLRDHRGKSMGTTCLTFASLIIVLVAFVVMFFVIRIT
ncbi:hypothetical protein FA95DRAFT_1463876, partial [Auriscalpium vulgare]